MEFFGRIRSEKKHRSEAVIDIGSHCIKAVVFEPPDARGATGAPRVLKKMAHRLSVGAERLRIAAKLHEIMFLLVRETGASLGKVTIAVGPHLADYSLASWPAGDNQRVSAFSGPELARMFENLTQAHAEVETALWAYPAAVFANGYAVQCNAAGSVSRVRFLQRAGPGKGASVSFGVISASLPRRVAEALEEARFAWGGMPIEFIPLPLAYVHALAGIGEAQDYLMIDIGGEETALARVQGGILRSIRFFPVGSREFIRAAAKDGNVSFREAEDMVRANGRGTARSPRETGKTRSAGATERAVRAWSDSFVRTLDADYHLGPLGERVILTGEGAELPEIEALARAGGWMQKFSHVSAPSVRILAGNNFFQGASLGGAVNGPEDAGLAALIRYAIRHKDFFS